MQNEPNFRKTKYDATPYSTITNHVPRTTNHVQKQTQNKANFGAFIAGKNSTFQTFSRTITSSSNKLKQWSINGNISFLKLLG
jgi:hypothetical protein